MASGSKAHLRNEKVRGSNPLSSTRGSLVEPKTCASPRVTDSRRGRMFRFVTPVSVITYPLDAVVHRGRRTRCSRLWRSPRRHTPRSRCRSEMHTADFTHHLCTSAGPSQQCLLGFPYIFFCRTTFVYATRSVSPGEFASRHRPEADPRSPHEPHGADQRVRQVLSSVLTRVIGTDSGQVARSLAGPSRRARNPHRHARLGAHEGLE